MLAHAPQKVGRRRALPKVAAALGVSLGAMAVLGAVLYAASASLPYLTLSPTTDPHLGALNQCLLNAVPGPRVGFAVALDGQAAAVFGAGHLARCRRGPAPQPLMQRWALGGVQHAAFDGGGNLWFSQEGPQGSSLSWLGPTDEAPRTFGPVAPLALAGHFQGVVVLDAQGRLLSVASDGQVLGAAELPAGPRRDAQLSVNADGTLVGVVAGTGVFVHRLPDLAPLLREGPCDVEYLWWLERPSQALLDCAPSASWSLWLDVQSKEREAVARRPRLRTQRLPGVGWYVLGCDGLPCTAPAPLASN